ncbi:MAG: aminoacyl-tRNA hydrolase [Gemmataceae bacterium]
MRVVVGLGNPGSKYSGTRHNIGFEVIDYLAKSPTVGPFRSKFQAQLAETLEGTEPVLLVKPETFMNLSGRAVRQILDFYKLTADQLLILSDDIHLPVGKLRMRASGSHGGQNGLRNIQEQLGTDAYTRLRIGVGEPNPGQAVDYVLGRFRPGERPQVDDSIAKAAAAVVVWIRQGLPAAMNLANAGEAKPKPPPKPRPPKQPPPEATTPPAKPTNDE